MRLKNLFPNSKMQFLECQTSCKNSILELDPPLCPDIEKNNTQKSEISSLSFVLYIIF